MIGHGIQYFFSLSVVGRLTCDEAPMNVQLPVHIDKPAFLDWVQGREERYELTEGRVVMMVGASRAHGLIVSNIVVVLRGQLDPQQWTVIADFGLDTGPDTLRYPDVVIDRAGGSAGDFVATAPVLLAEVLSPSTAEVDLGDKAAEYLRLPSLLAYPYSHKADTKPTFGRATRTDSRRRRR
jgi:Uma2 family endonuclease